MNVLVLQNLYKLSFVFGFKKWERGVKDWAIPKFDVGKMIFGRPYGRIKMTDFIYFFF